MLAVALLGIIAIGRASSAAARQTSIPLPASFSGYSCSVYVTMTLRRDGIGFIREIMKGRELANGRGKFALNASGTRLVFSDDSNDQGPFYQIIDDRTLQRLSGTGGPSDSKCDERLRRTSRIITISGVLKPVTLYSDVWTATEPESGEDDAGVPARFSLDPGRLVIAGSTGCGPFSGKYAVDGVRMHFTHIVARDAACSNAMKRSSRKFIASLEKTMFYHLCCDTLELRDGKRELAAFRTSRV